MRVRVFDLKKPGQGINIEYHSVIIRKVYAVILSDAERENA